MSDIVERLRDEAETELEWTATYKIMTEAAAEIERLRSELDDLDVALEAEKAWKQRLRLALTTAHAEGMEEAARIIDHLNGWGSDYGRGGHAEHFAAAIRRAKESKT
jgi:hypothetical protein